MWVARDKNIKYCYDNETSFLWLYFGSKPIRNNKPYDPNLCDMDYTGCWLAQDYGLIIPLDNSLFPNLKWEDEPVEVSIVPINILDDIRDSMWNRGMNNEDIQNISKGFLKRK